MVERDEVEVESVEERATQRAESSLLFFELDLALSLSFPLVLLFSSAFHLSLVDDDQRVRRELGLGRLDERADGGDLLKK